MTDSQLFHNLAVALPAVLYSKWCGDEKGYFPIAIAATIHAIKVSYQTRKILQLNGRRHLASEFILQVVYGFGGAIISSFVLGLPQPWLESNSALPLQIVTFLALTNLPGDFLFNLMDMVSPFSDVLLAVGDGIITGYGITSGGVDLVKFRMSPQKISNSIVAMLFVGTAMGCGGGSISNFFQLEKPPGAQRTISMSNLPFFEMKLSAFLALFYVSTTRLWSFSANAPSFILSGYLDTVINTFVIQLSSHEAKLVVSSIYGTVMGYKSYLRSVEYGNAIARLAAQHKNKNKSKDNIKKASTGKSKAE